MDLNKFQEWVKEGKGRRHASITMGEPGDSNHIRIFVYDYSLQDGQSVNSVEEINIEAKLQNEELETYKRLKAKYEVQEGIA